MQLDLRFAAGGPAQLRRYRRPRERGSWSRSR